MPRYKLTTEKYYSSFGEYFSNVYQAEATDLPAAKAIGQLLIDAEKPLYTSGTTIVKCHVENTGLASTEYGNVVANVQGTRTAPTTDMVALFVVSWVDFEVLGGGRPSRKYLRGTLAEEDMIGMNIQSAQLARLNTYAAAIVAANVCDIDGQVFISGAARTTITNRQLRRGSKKKITLSDVNWPPSS